MLPLMGPARACGLHELSTGSILPAQQICYLPRDRPRAAAPLAPVLGAAPSLRPGGGGGDTCLLPQVVEPRVTAYLYTWGEGRITSEGESIAVRTEELEIGYIDGMLCAPLPTPSQVSSLSLCCAVAHPGWCLLHTDFTLSGAPVPMQQTSCRRLDVSLMCLHQGRGSAAGCCPSLWSIPLMSSRPCVDTPTTRSWRCVPSAPALHQHLHSQLRAGAWPVHCLQGAGGATDMQCCSLGV